MSQPQLLDRARVSKEFLEELDDVVQKFSGGSRDIGEISKELEDPLHNLKEKYTDLGFFQGPSDWVWDMKVVKDTIHFSSKAAREGMKFKDEFTCKFQLPYLN